MLEYPLSELFESTVTLPNGVWLVPICTLPNSTLAGVAMSLAPLCAPDQTELTPWHPSMVASARRAAIVLQHVPTRFISEALHRTLCAG